MIIPETLLRAFDPEIYDAVESCRVYEDSLMPWEYQRANPKGRTLHDDWAIFKDTPRIETARRVPLPFKQISGASEKRWMLWDSSYPTAPGTVIESRPIWDGVKTQVLPHALVDCAVEGSGAAEFAVWLEGKWTPCFKTYRKKVLGRLLAYYSGGLKQDLTVGFDEKFNLRSDVMAWFDPPTMSWNSK